MTTAKSAEPGLARDEGARLARTHPALPALADGLADGRVDRRDFLRTATLLGLSASAAYALAGRLDGGAGAGPAAAAETPVAGGRLRCSMNVKEITDPATFDWPEKANVARHIVEPLCTTGPDNVTRPWLAERWEASDDLKTWTFHLRRGVTWSNGDRFTAEDVVANVTRWLDPATGSSNLGRFASMTVTEGGTTRMAPGAVEAVDDHTVRFHLRVPDLAIPEGLGDYPALIVHRRFADEGGDLLANPVGTGPYALETFKVGEVARLHRRDAPYWGRAPLADRITFIDHGDDQAAWLAALVSGQVDLLYRVFVEQVPLVRRMPNLVLHEAKSGQTGVARMKVTEPPFDNPKVRQAVQAAIDPARALQLAYQGLGVPAEHHHVGPMHPEYAPLPAPRQDHARARRLLAEAGYPDGLTLTIDCVAQPTWEPNTCQVLAEMLRPAGIDLKINILPGGTYWDRWMTTPFGFTSWAHRPLGVQTLNLAYRSGADWNETSYANPAFDALLDRALGLVDPVERRATMAELERTLQADAVIAQPFWVSEFTASSVRLRGFTFNPSKQLDLDTAWLA